MRTLWTGIQGSVRLRSKQNLLLHNHRLPSHGLESLQTLHPRREHPRSARLLWLLPQTWISVMNSQRKLLKQFPLLPRSQRHPSQNPNPQLHPPRLPHLLLPEPPPNQLHLKELLPQLQRQQEFLHPFHPVFPHPSVLQPPHRKEFPLHQLLPHHLPHLLMKQTHHPQPTPEPMSPEIFPPPKPPKSPKQMCLISKHMTTKKNKY